MNNTVMVTEADNGWIIKYPNPNAEGVVTEVVEAPNRCNEGDFNYEKAVEKLLLTIKDGLGIYGSKHNVYRCSVSVRDQRNE